MHYALKATEAHRPQNAESQLDVTRGTYSPVPTGSGIERPPTVTILDLKFPQKHYVTASGGEQCASTTTRWSIMLDSWMNSCLMYLVTADS